MQTAAITRRFLISYSSKVGFVDSGIVVRSRGELIEHIVASHLAESFYSEETLVQLTRTLIHFAELAYALRDVDALQEISSVLTNLSVVGARQIGLYYQALAVKRKGLIDEAQPLLEMVADNAPATYQARAIQTLGASRFDQGRPEEALRFQLEALRVASHKNAHGLQTTLLANLEISHVKSESGDHKGALCILEGLSPLVQIVSRQNPLYFYFYHNELAVELGELNRITEAEAASAIAVASPFAHAYPEWVETRQDIAAKRRVATRSLVAIHRASENIQAIVAKAPTPAAQSNRLDRQRKSKAPTRLALSWSASDSNIFQRSITPFPARTTTTFGSISILDRVLVCIGPRAPPFPSNSTGDQPIKSNS